MRTFGVLTTMGFLLACGGLGGGGSEQAQKLCEHLAKGDDGPCLSVGVGSPVVIDDMEVVIEAVTPWKGKSTLPEIQNMDERATFKRVDGEALVLELAVTNTKPVKADVAIGKYLMTGGGDEVYNQPYNSKVYMADKEDWMDLWNDDVIGPGRTRRVALVFPVASADVEGTKLILTRSEKRPDPEDPRGRMKRFVEERFVVDLGPPT